MVRPVDLHALAAVSAQLEKLNVDFAFTGGAVVGFLLDNPRIVRLRPTGDVDAIAAVVTRIQYTALEERLRQLDFQHDTSEDAPICRWLYQGIKVDVMPAKDPTGQFSDRWFEYALQTASHKTLDGVTVRTVGAACFIATKLNAFEDRGRNDYLSSHDLEDIVTVIDGRRSLVAELAAESADLRDYVSGKIRRLLAQQGFMDALPGHLEGEEASQRRLSLLIERLQTIAGMLQPLNR